MAGEYVLQVSEPKFSDLSLSFCGYSDCQPGYSFGPAVRPNYIIHYILSGKGTFQIGDSVYPLKKGDGFLGDQVNGFYAGLRKCLDLVRRAAAVIRGKAIIRDLLDPCVSGQPQQIQTWRQAVYIAVLFG